MFNDFLSVSTVTATYWFSAFNVRNSNIELVYSAILQLKGKWKPPS